MSRGLRVVKPGETDGVDYTMAEAMQDLVAKAIAAAPVTFLMVFETADGKVHYQALPPAASVVRGLVDHMFDQIHPDPTAEA